MQTQLEKTSDHILSAMNGEAASDYIESKTNLLACRVIMHSEITKDFVPLPGTSTKSYTKQLQPIPKNASMYRSQRRQ